MSGNPRLGVMMSAAALAMRARLAPVEACAVSALVAQVNAIDQGGALSMAVQRFAGAMAAARFDAVARSAAGDALRDQVIACLRPEPIDAGRVDIHG